MKRQTIIETDVYVRNAQRGVIPLELFLAKVAKVLCSAVFLSGRDLDEARRNSARHVLFIYHVDDVLLDLFDVEIERERHEATASLTMNARLAKKIVEGYRAFFSDYEADWVAEEARLAGLGRIARTARYTGDQGSTILPSDGRLQFTPTEVRTTLPDAATVPWPKGDRLGDSHQRSHLDRAKVAAAIDQAFIDPDATTTAVAVVHRGELVGERYVAGTRLDTQLESWSMGKSLTASLLGVLVHQGLISVDEPAPLREWQQPGDERASITVRDLLQMSGGLLFSGQDDPRQTWRSGVPDHLYVYCEALDAFEFCINRPPEHPPGTVGRYRNCDPLALGCIIRRTVEERLYENYLQWPQAALFDRIGIRRQILETNLYGNFLLTGFDYGTPRNWARLGLLYLQDGMWEGRRVLPEGWSRFVSTPAPAWPEPRYGGQFWLNATSDYDGAPRDMYSMAGAGEQRTFIIPSAELVVVRMGRNNAIGEAAKQSSNRMLRALISLVG